MLLLTIETILYFSYLSLTLGYKIFVLYLQPLPHELSEDIQINLKINNFGKFVSYFGNHHPNQETMKLCSIGVHYISCRDAHAFLLSGWKGGIWHLSWYQPRLVMSGNAALPLEQPCKIRVRIAARFLQSASPRPLPGLLQSFRS